MATVKNHRGSIHGETSGNKKVTGCTSDPTPLKYMGVCV